MTLIARPGTVDITRYAAIVLVAEVPLTRTMPGVAGLCRLPQVRLLARRRRTRLAQKRASAR